ncbi:MAG: peptide chain release factor 1 [Ruminococcaceae bacterium]|nr:peptide chain release factor 1 [Oscillospiraceae bacterium]
MLEKVKEIERKYRGIEAELAQPETYADIERCAALNKELTELQPLVEAFLRHKTLTAQLSDAEAMLQDAELGELAREELPALRAALEDCAEEIKKLLLPKDPRDSRSVIVEIRAGVGGEEGALFAADLYRMYSMYAQQRGWKTEIANINETELGGIKEISFLVDGQGAYSRLKFESGVHRVQRVPETETQGRIHTSACTVAVLPEADEQEFQLDLNDVQIDTFRSSGAGGQKVNKTSSAIRVTHLPTGTVVECQDERSQYKNKARALSILASRLADAERQRQEASVAAERRSQVGSGDRSERIRTYNFPQSRVTDHRIGLTLHRLDAVMNGELDEIMDALLTADEAARLKEK